MKLDLKVPEGLESIVSDIARAGGKTYLVGGAVIDSIKGRQIKDWDIEVYNLCYQRLNQVLSGHGKTNLVGKSFGIIKLRNEYAEYDFNIPRKENNLGIGHNEFSIELTPEISPEEAAYRRDLTINSMFVDLSDFELLDPYSGLKDLEQGVLRHTSDKFSEDPLRVLRVMQLLPRKGKTVAKETIELCKSMADQYYSLTKERVFEEWRKLLLNSDKPSLGLNFLVDCNWIKHYPILDNLRYTNQNLKHHPEGNVWNHTLLVVDNAARLRDNLPKDWQEAYMFGCLLHDVGKFVATEEDLTAKGHDELGVPLAYTFMKRTTDKRDLIKKTLDIVRYHMRPGDLTRQNSKENAWKRLHNHVPLNVIAYVSKADGLGRLGRSLSDFHKPSTKALALAEKKEYSNDKIPPILMGRHLIEKGYAPGPYFGKMLRIAYNLQIDEGVNDKEELFSRTETEFKSKYRQ